MRFADHALELRKRPPADCPNASREPKSSGKSYGLEPVNIAATEHAGCKATANQRHRCDER
jgi:hypothetical protein